MNTNSQTAPFVEPHQWTNGGDKVLILRRCNPDGTSSHGFTWKMNVGDVNESPDWDETCKCGGGLHGWPWGMGLGQGSDFDIIHDTFLVLAASPQDVVGNIGGQWKCKVRVASVVESGSFGKCWDYIQKGRDLLICQMASSGDRSTAASSGYYSTAASSGYCSTAASSGDSSTAASSGDSSTAASSGDSSTAASSGYASKAVSSGDRSTAVSSGDSSTAVSSGYSSTSVSSGDSSTAEQSGKHGIAASIGGGGMVSAGECGLLIACYWDGIRYRACIGYVGEDGIKPNTLYTADKETGKLKETE